MPSIIAGLLTMGDIALHAITRGEVYMESLDGGSWSAGVWRDLSGVTIEVDDVPEGAKALILFDASMRSQSTGHRFLLRAVMDGVAYPVSTVTTESDGTGRFMPAAYVAFIPELSAGSHVFKIQAQSAGTASQSYWANLRHIVAILKR